jgi:hypothetical protein
MMWNKKMKIGRRRMRKGTEDKWKRKKGKGGESSF